MNLFIDTTNDYLIIFLFHDEELIAKYLQKSNRQLAENFINILDDILISNNTCLQQINNYYICNGPGSFTGIRVGLTFGKALRTNSKNNVYILNSLSLLCPLIEGRMAYIDARGNKYYTIKYENNSFTNLKLENDIDTRLYDCYDTQLGNIFNNLVGLIKENNFHTVIEACYIKEAF